jgi:predicted O-linked N-acetylglucosamine transferase (SPINDLY family)
MLFELANLLKLSGLGSVARSIYHRLLALEPARFDAWCNLSNLQLASGQHGASGRSIERASAIDPADPLPHKKRLGLILYVETDPARIYSEHRRAMRALGLGTGRGVCSPRLKTSEPIRVGFVSSDFVQHPVAGNLRAFFEYRRRDEWHLSAYANVESPDAVTEWYRGKADSWRDISMITHEQACADIRAGRLDLLIFLAGRFNANWFFVKDRLAPIQISFHDGATSAGSEIDYWITDPVLHPPGSRERFDERLAKLPVFYSFDPPAVRLGEAQRAGPVSFGVFNNPAKITPAMVSLWSRILTTLPDARIGLKYGSSMSDPMTRARLLDQFGAAGIGAGRVTFLSPSPTREEHLAAIAGFDVSLDTFPFTGATTTFESLWMGTPVVTLAGETFIQRAAASILHAAGMGELVATDPVDYVRIAVTAGRTAGARTPKSRESIRKRVRASPLCDGPAYAEALGRLLKELAR